MKTILIYVFLLSAGLFHFSDSPSDFERKLSSIANEFREKIMNEDDCKDLMNDASRIADDIEDELKEDDKYSASEVNQFKEVKKKAEALESFIGTVGGCSSSSATIEDFNIANRMVGFSVTNVVQGKFCVDFISVSTEQYIVYLGENNAINNYVVTYKHKSPNGMNTGSGYFGLSSKSVRHLYDNREKPNQKTIIIFGVTCKTF